MPTSTLTSKGQITLPKEVRDQLHLKTGSKVEFITDPSGQIVLKPRIGDFESLRGIVKSKRKRPASIEEMNVAIARGYAGK
jgi:AbrB family looped-hinge helix DNA binding protein